MHFLLSASSVSRRSPQPTRWARSTSSRYTPGTINGQDGWRSSGPYDHKVDATTAKPAGFGAQSLRISNAVVSGSFGDQTFSKSLANEAGETSAENGGKSGGVRQSYFESQFQFTSTTADHQEGAYLTVSPDRGDGARMSWVKISDTADGARARVLRVQERRTGSTRRSPPLDRTQVHTLKLTMQFVDGPANDVVKVFVDGDLKHTDTSWEDYFRTVEHNADAHRRLAALPHGLGNPTDARPDLAGKGFLIDNLTLTSAVRGARVHVHDERHDHDARRRLHHDTTDRRAGRLHARRQWPHDHGRRRRPAAFDGAVVAERAAPR